MIELNLPKCEQDIMIYIWRQNRSVALREVAAYFLSKKGWAKSTTHTVLGRLCQKGYLQCTKQLRKNIYTALVLQRDFLCENATQTVERLFQGSVTKFLYTYYNVNTPTQKEIDEILDLMSSLKPVS